MEAMEHTRSGGSPAPTSAERLAEYLRLSRWRFEDEDAGTSLWLSAEDAHTQIQVVVPKQTDHRDYAERMDQALAAMAYAERRRVEEVLRDVDAGGADGLSVRLFPPAPPGAAPLDTAHAAFSSLRQLVVGSAVGAEAAADVLVLPSRRPARAEAYVSQTLVTTRPGSFIIDAFLPLTEVSETLPPPVESTGGADPFGRRVTRRMLAVVTGATALATRVGEGETGITDFAGESAPGNATELAALAGLGVNRDGQGRYQLRFSQTPLWQSTPGWRPRLVTVTPAQQTVLRDAASYLRERQPRQGITVEGLVVRLSRDSAAGAGDVVVEGVVDDTGDSRRFAVNLSEPDYADALRAHREGYRVVVVGDLDVRGTRRSLRNIASFDVLSQPDR